jgi:site-specific DNA recombinase
LRRIIWQCNNKYLVKGEKGCESKHIDDKVLYQAFVNTFNAVVENREQLTPKWQRLIKEDDILKRIYAERFLAIFSTAEPIGKFDFALYYKLVEKITVQDEGRLIVALHEGTEIEYEIK